MSCQHGLFEISFACTYVWQALSQFSSVLIQLYYKPEEKLVDLLRVRRYIDPACNALWPMQAICSLLTMF